MKTYIVYSPAGIECGMVKARSHNAAESLAILIHGIGSSVVYTEI